MESLEWVRGDKLGEGVTGEVFTAHHQVHGLCAAKVLKVTEPLLYPLLLVLQLVIDARSPSVTQCNPSTSWTQHRIITDTCSASNDCEAHNSTSSSPA